MEGRPVYIALILSVLHINKVHTANRIFTCGKSVSFDIYVCYVHQYLIGHGFKSLSNNNSHELYLHVLLQHQNFSTPPKIFFLHAVFQLEFVNFFKSVTGNSFLSYSN